MIKLSCRTSILKRGEPQTIVDQGGPKLMEHFVSLKDYLSLDIPDESSAINQHQAVKWVQNVARGSPFLTHCRLDLLTWTLADHFCPARASNAWNRRRSHSQASRVQNRRPSPSPWLQVKSLGPTIFLTWKRSGVELNTCGQKTESPYLQNITAIMSAFRSLTRSQRQQRWARTPAKLSPCWSYRLTGRQVGRWSERKRRNPNFHITMHSLGRIRIGLPILVHSQILLLLLSILLNLPGIRRNAKIVLKTVEQAGRRATEAKESAWSPAQKRARSELDCPPDPVAWGAGAWRWVWRPSGAWLPRDHSSQNLGHFHSSPPGGTGARKHIGTSWCQ